MRELIKELRRLHFTIAIPGGGTEFVRAVSQELYVVPPEAVVGTLIDYDYRRTEQGPVLRRSLGCLAHRTRAPRRPLAFKPSSAAGPSSRPGTPEVTGRCWEWVAAADAPTLALLVDHDDAEREFAYISRAETVAEPEPITDVGHRQSWTVISMARDWDSVFAPEG